MTNCACRHCGMSLIAWFTQKAELL